MKKSTVATGATVLGEEKPVLAAGGNDADRLVYFVNGFVDVPKSALLEALSESVVLFVGAAQAARVVETGVNRRMVVQILAVIDRGLLDFVDRLIDRVDGFLFLVAKFAAVVTFEMGASCT